MSAPYQIPVTQKLVAAIHTARLNAIVILVTVAMEKHAPVRNVTKNIIKNHYGKHAIPGNLPFFQEWSPKNQI